MILYKNVDIIDLPSIMERGIVSMDEIGNDNWVSGKRAKNATNVVYLFKPAGEQNSFTQYGAALIEVDVPDELVRENELLAGDVNRGKYREWVCYRVAPDMIRAVYIPALFKEYLPAMEGVTWCGLRANWYGEGFEKVACPPEVLARFAETASFVDSKEFNFFRGLTVEQTMIDLYDVVYEF